MPENKKHDANSEPKPKTVTFSIAEDGEAEVIVNSPVVSIYNAYVETAEKNIDRRHTANKFYMGATGAVLFAFSFIISEGTDLAELSKSIVSAIFFILLFLVQCFWFASVIASRQLSRSKYQVIEEIEREHLPVRPFGREWELHKEKKRLSLSFTRIELLIPVVIGIATIAGLVLMATGIVPVFF